MLKKDIAEIKKQFKEDNHTITSIHGRVFNPNKEEIGRINKDFYSLDESEAAKYLDIFKKTLSGGIGKTLYNFEFPLKEENKDGSQKALLELRDSRLEDEEILDDFFADFSAKFHSDTNYLVLLSFGAYDVPGKAKDGAILESEEVYEYVLCSVCPIKLAKPALRFNQKTRAIDNADLDFIINAPAVGFLFPAFEERTTDIHKFLYFAKTDKEKHRELIENFFHLETPLSASDEMDVFQELIKESLKEDCSYELVKNIHEELTELLEESLEEDVTIGKEKFVKLLEDSHLVGMEKVIDFESLYDNKLKDKSLSISNIINTKIFEVKCPDVVIKVNADATDRVKTKVVDGEKCFVIGMNASVEVNGISVS